MKPCPRCSTSVQDQVSFCPSCGNAFASVPGTGGLPVAGAMPPGYPAYAAYNGPEENSGKAVASLVFGLLFFIPFAFVAAIVLGHMAHSEIKKSAGRLKGQGIATAGLVLGYGTVLFIPFILIIAAIAIPNLLRARMAANEASAIGILRTYNTALATYADRCPANGYPALTRVLGPGSGDCDGANLVNAELAGRQLVRNGYIFFYGAYSRGNRQARPNVYTIAADPVAPNTTGVRHFFTDQSGVIRYADGGSATVNSPPIE
jgi:type IV pilus assembly protein PilA